MCTSRFGGLASCDGPKFWHVRPVRMVMVLIKKTLVEKDSGTWQTWIRQLLHHSEQSESCECLVRERPSIDSLCV